jgi:hypothetical protein
VANDYVERLLKTFVESASEREWVILIDPDDDGQFVQFMVTNGTVYAELSSRQWGGERRVLEDSNELGLFRLGFTHGGPGKNYALDGLTADGPYLADLARKAFRTGYGKALPERPLVKTEVDAVAAVVAASSGALEPLTLDFKRARGFHCPLCEDEDPWVGGQTGPGLMRRIRMTVRQNFIRIQLDCEDHVLLVDALRRARTFDELPEQVQDWILKAGEGPLRQLGAIQGG